MSAAPALAPAFSAASALDLSAGIAHFNARVAALRAAIATGIIGNDELITDVLVALLRASADAVDSK